MRYYSEETVKKIMTKVEVDSFPSNLYDTSLRTVERIYPDLNKFDSIEIPESPWHTGMPTEEGLYVVLTKVTTIGIHSSEITYILDWWDGYCFKNLKQMARYNPVFGNDVYSWVKWQKIEEKTE